MSSKNIPASLLYTPSTEQERIDWAQTVQSAALALVGAHVDTAPRADLVMALEMLGVREMLAMAAPRYDPPVEPVTV
jgi:hypothetical protein